MREESDYNCVYVTTAEEMQPLFEPVREFIAKVGNLINENSDARRRLSLMSFLILSVSSPVIDAGNISYNNSQCKHYSKSKYKLRFVRIGGKEYICRLLST